MLNLHVCKNIYFLCAQPGVCTVIILEENNGNIQIFVWEKCECITVVSYAHPFLLK